MVVDVTESVIVAGPLGPVGPPPSSPPQPETARANSSATGPAYLDILITPVPFLAPMYGIANKTRASR